MLVWIARARKGPCALETLEMQMGFWGTKWQMKEKVSNAARVRYLNQSTWLCRPQVGQMALLVKKSVSDPTQVQTYEIPN